MSKREKRDGKQKMNTYLKLAVIMVISLCAGGILGFIAGYAGSPDVVAVGMSGFLYFIRRRILAITCLFFVLSILCGEGFLARIKKISRQMAEAGDEETDILEYRMERMGTAGMVASNVFEILAFLLICTGYTGEYVESMVLSEIGFFAAGLAACLLQVIYLAVWQIRYVKLLQRIYPEKKGDPMSWRFQEQWLASCDEAEKETIYQGSYRTCLLLLKALPFFALAAMLCDLLWHTGIMAVVLTSAIWLLTSVSYCRYNLKKKGEKLRE